MITSKEVFAKRKEGAIDEAYRMALELMGGGRRSTIGIRKPSAGA